MCELTSLQYLYFGISSEMYPYFVQPFSDEGLIETFYFWRLLILTGISLILTVCLDLGKM